MYKPHRPRFINEDMLAIALRDKLDLIRWLQEHNLLAKHYECPACRRSMRLAKSKRTSDGWAWRCDQRGANPHIVRRTVRGGSWFADSHMDLHQIVKIACLWVTKSSNAQFYNSMGLSAATIAEWRSNCREVCMDFCINSMQPLGGVDVSVQLDECMFGTRKYNRGRRASGECGEWVYGGIERVTGNCFMQVVESRTREVLLDVVRRHILPGSLIITNGWRAFDCLTSAGYKHEIVERRKDAGAKWGMRCKFKTDLYSHLYERMFRRRNVGYEMEAFFKQIAVSYPPLIRDIVRDSSYAPQITIKEVFREHSYARRTVKRTHEIPQNESEGEENMNGDPGDPFINIIKDFIFNVSR